MSQDPVRTGVYFASPLGKALRARDEEALDAELCRLRERLMRIAHAILRDPTLAEDMTQATILNLIEYARDAETEIREPASLAATIVRNHCLGKRREAIRWKHVVSFVDVNADDADRYRSLADDSFPHEAAERKERLALLRKAWQHLNPEQQKILRGFYWEGKSQAAMADELKMTVRSLYNHRQKALDALTKKYRQAENGWMQTPGR